MVTANYTMRQTEKSKSLIGAVKRLVNMLRSAKAKIVDKKTNAKLKVTFFWPFYGDYWILDLAQTMNTPWSASLVASIFGY